MESKEETQDSEQGADGEKEAPKKEPVDWSRKDVVVQEDDGEY